MRLKHATALPFYEMLGLGLFPHQCVETRHGGFNSAGTAGDSCKVSRVEEKRRSFSRKKSNRLTVVFDNGRDDVATVRAAWL